uniref:Apolipoprotein C-I n=1 Tax=Mola mola TaxID=94237 RepID=A0A3Q4AWR8_MOLML
MKLYLAVAVLMLAFVAHTEAQEEETVGSTFTRFGDHVTDMTRGLVDRTRDAFHKIKTSDFATKTKNWFESFKTRIGEIIQ